MCQIVYATKQIYIYYKYQQQKFSFFHRSFLVARDVTYGMPEAPVACERSFRLDRAFSGPLPRGLG